MRTKVLMTFVYILLVVCAVSIVFFICNAFDSNKHGLVIAYSITASVSCVIIVTLLAFKKKWKKQDSDQETK